MSNGIVKIGAMQYAMILDNTPKSKAFVAEIDGENIKNMDDYLSAVWRAFRFPQTGHVNYYAYLDWIRDLDWLGTDAYIFAIRDFQTFMDKAPKEKEIILNSLENIVIPWWDSEIEKFQVEGLAKPFKVYLVD